MTHSTFKTVNGLGTFEISPGCTIHVPPDTNIRPEYLIGQELLEDESIIAIVHDKVNNIIYPQALNVSTSTFKPLIIQNVTSLSQGIDLIFNHDSALTEIVRVIIYIAIVLFFLFTIAMCYKPFKDWVATFCLCRKPEAFWRKWYDMPRFARREKPVSPKMERNNIKKGKTLRERAVDILKPKVRSHKLDLPNSQMPKNIHPIPLHINDSLNTLYIPPPTPIDTDKYGTFGFNKYPKLPNYDTRV